LNIFRFLSLCCALSLFSFGAFPQTISLPKPSREGAVSLEEALDTRKSIRRYTADALRMDELSQLLWAAYGNNKWQRQTSPSAGALYPLFMYVVVGRVEGLDVGTYRYDYKTHSLVYTSGGDVRKELASHCFNQQWVSDAACLIIICADYTITTSHYGKRGKRYVDIEVGHVGQNIYLEATALNLGTVAVGAFHDGRLKKTLGVKQDPLYLMPIGRPKQNTRE